MIFIRYEANGEEIRAENNPIDATKVERKRILPTRPIPKPARRNYLLPDRVKIENERKAKQQQQKEAKNSENEKFKFKYLLRFLLQNFGILFVAFVYIVIGAYIFQYIEQPNEIAQCQTGEGTWKRLLYDNRVLFYNYIYYNTTANSFLLQNDPYAIPSLISERDNSTVYQPKLTQMLQDFRDSILSISSDYNYSGQDCVSDSQWNIISAILFTLSILSTIGLNKIGNLLSESYKYIYMKFLSYIVNGRKTIMGQIPTQVGEKAKSQTHKNFDSFFFNDDHSKNNENDKIQDDQSDSEDGKAKKVTVPLFLVLLSVIGYLMFGGYLFTQLGDEWNLVQSIYGSYQAVSTIGFGDYVSGWTFIQNNQPDLGGRNLLISCLYSIVGMSILGMTFNLMQDTIKTKIDQIKEALTPSKDDTKKENHNANDFKSLEIIKQPFEEQNLKNNSPVDILKNQLAILKSLKEEKALFKAKELLGVEDKKKLLSDKIKKVKLSSVEVKNLPKIKSKPELPPEARPSVNIINKMAYELKVYEKLNDL